MITFQLSTGETVLLDDQDAELATLHWHRNVGHRTTYVVRSVRGAGRRKRFWLHRLVLAAPDGTPVDHINGDGLDNRRANLRLASVAENNRNRRPGVSGVKGVHQKPNGRWMAFIQLDGHQRHLGYFGSQDEAIAAYDEAALILFGAFARPNRLPDRRLDPDLARGLTATASRDEGGPSIEGPVTTPGVSVAGSAAVLRAVAGAPTPQRPAAPA